MSPVATQASSARTVTRRAGTVIAELVGFLAPVALLLWTLRQTLASLSRAPWGPADPWGNGDFVGNFWCWWREAELHSGGIEWLDATGWPGGGGVLDQLFPNRMDAVLALPWFTLDSWWTTWNSMALISLVAAVLATVLAARLAGASRAAAACAGLVLAMSPTLLHELGWGRMAGSMIWPGLLALAGAAAAIRVRRTGHALLLAGLAGFMVWLQTVAYPFHGVAAGVAAVTVLGLSPAPARRRVERLAAFLVVGAVVGVPWLASQAADFSAMAGAPPPAGYTALPIAGLWGLPIVPERFRLLPLVLPAGLLALGPKRARPWAVAGLLVLGLALGPSPVWAPEGHALPSPTALLMAVSSWLARMHHPVRAAPIGLAALGIGVALLLDPTQRRLRWLRVGGCMALWASALLTHAAVTRVTTWDQPTEPAGADAARWLADHGEGPVADLLSGQHMAGVALQPWHRRPVLETVQGYGPASGGGWSPDQQRAAEIIEALSAGEDPGPQALVELQDFGVRALLVVDRRSQRPGSPAPEPAQALLQTHLGPSTYADDEAWIWQLHAEPTKPR